MKNFFAPLFLHNPVQDDKNHLSPYLLLSLHKASSPLATFITLNAMIRQYSTKEILCSFAALFYCLFR